MMSSLKWLKAVALTAVCTQPAVAAPPLIYEGMLTADGVAPNPWPALRFSFVGPDGGVHWTTVLEADGAISTAEDGRFVAYLEDSIDNPLAGVGFGDQRALRVEVCAGNPCDWVALAPSQDIGSVPSAVEAGSRLITRDLTLLVSSPAAGAPLGSFRSLHEALDSLNGRMILPGASVTIRIAPGIYPPLGQPAYDSPVVIARHDGSRISIVGDEDRPQDVRLRFLDSSGMIVLSGSRLGGLSGLTLDAEPGGRAGLVGLHVPGGAYATVGPGVVVSNFTGVCVLVDAGTLDAEGLVAEGCGDDGLIATQGGVTRCHQCETRNHGDYGMASTLRAYLRCEDCVIEGSPKALIAHDHALLELRGDGTRVSDDNATLFRAENLSEVRAQGIGNAAQDFVDDTSVVVH